MRWLKKQYHRYMIRPIVTKTITRTLIGLVIVLLWDKYVNVERIGVSRLGFGLGAVGIILMAGAWFSYLHLDGLTPIDTAKKKFRVKNKKKKEIQKKEAVEAEFADELKNGTLVFRTIDISEPKNEAIAEKYEVTWSSLFISKWKAGKETYENLTQYGIANARTPTATYKNGVAEKLRT